MPRIMWKPYARIKRTPLVLMLFLNLSLIFSLTGCTSPGDISTPKQTQESNFKNMLTEKTINVIEATVGRVVDGDTIEISLNGKKEKVRMIGVNTPETHHPDKPVEPYGPEAEEFTRSQLEGKKIYLELDVQERDRYGRILAYIWLNEPQSDSENEITDKMFNAKLVIEGYAQIMTIPPNVKYVDAFVALEKQAKQADKGLWGDETNEKGPNGETIKGNINSKGEKIYHVPGGQFYEGTVPEQWFFTEEEAKAAGFRPSQR